MLWTLIKIQFSGVFSRQKGTINDKPKSKFAKIMTGMIYIALILYVMVVFLGMFGANFMMIAEAIEYFNVKWLYFSMAGISAFGLGFVGSVFMTQKQVFEAQDNELLLSMPIKPSVILLSRLCGVMALAYIFEAVVVAPALFVWIYNFGFDLMQVINFIICFALLPLLIVSVSCLFAWLITLLIRKIRRKSLFITGISIVFLGLYFYFIYNVTSYINVILMYPEQIAETVQSTFYPAYVLGMAIYEANFIYLLIFAAICLVPFALTYILLSSTFIKLATDKKGVAKLEYKKEKTVATSAKKALFRKELAQFTNNSAYLLNAGMGSIMMLIGAVALVFYRDTMLLYASIFESEMLLGFAVTALTFIAVCDIITAPSISLEGNRLWVLRSMPVSSMDIMMAKVKLHLFFAVPPLLALAAAVVYVFPFRGIELILVFIAPVLMVVFSALLGIIANLKHPKLDYVNETAVVKNSASVIITMFGTMAIVMAIVLIYAFLLIDFVSMTNYLILMTVLIAIVDVLQYTYIKTKGVEMFENLQA